MFIQVYRILITLIFPILRITYIPKRKKEGKEHPLRFNERLGLYKRPRPAGKLFWMHGASVGEAISMLPLIDKLLREDKDLSILVTTGTVTSAEIMEKRLPERAFHQFIVFDTPKFAKRLLNHFKPDAVLWFESELWPSLLSETHRRHIPLVLVNGRISDKSFEIWKKVKFIAKEILDCFSFCLGQSEQDKRRLLFLGAKKAACFGNLKYAGVPLPVDEVKLKELKEVIGYRPVFFISSTHSNEEDQLSIHLKMLQQAVPDVLILLVPRHPHRGAEIRDMLERRGFKVELRSKGGEIHADTDIYIADTIGEMGLWYQLAQVSFVGGSLISHGGQNFMEPARAKNAVLVGPYMHNFTEMLARAQAAHAVWQVQNAADVVEEIINLLRDESLLKERQEAAYQWTVKESSVLDGISQALKQELK